MRDTEVFRSIVRRHQFSENEKQSIENNLVVVRNYAEQLKCRHFNPNTDLQTSFTWDWSPQGYDFWRNLWFWGRFVNVRP